MGLEPKWLRVEIGRRGVSRSIISQIWDWFIHRRGRNGFAVMWGIMKGGSQSGIKESHGRCVTDAVMFEPAGLGITD